MNHGKAERIRYYLKNHPFESTGFDTQFKYRMWIKDKLLEEGLSTTFDYVKTFITRENSKLVKTKITTHSNGDQTITESLRDTSEIDTAGMELVGVTTSPYGGQYAKYKSLGVDYEELFSILYDKIGNPTKEKIKPETIKGDCAAVINMYDAHLDKIAVKSIQGKSGSVEENAERFLNGVKKSLSICKAHKVEQIILPIGSDLFHTNGMNNKTKRGTEIQYLCHPEEAYAVICETVIKTVELALKVAPVWIPYVPGNHDRDKVSALGFWMGKLFANNKYYKSDTNILQRTYRTYGKWFFAFAHGDKFKNKIHEAPLITSQEEPMQWAKAKARKIYLGDQHHQFEYKFLKSKDYPGTSVEYLRSVGLDDEYHCINGWIGVPHTVYVDIYRKDSTETYRSTFDL